MERPRPIPLSLKLTKGSKMVSIWSGLMPHPWSVMDIMRKFVDFPGSPAMEMIGSSFSEFPFSTPVQTKIVPPSGMDWMALMIIFKNSSLI